MNDGPRRLLARSLRVQITLSTIEVPDFAIAIDAQASAPDTMVLELLRLPSIP